MQDALVIELARHWRLDGPLSVRLISRSENDVFAVDDGAGIRRILRLCRPGYQSRAGVASELAWLADVARTTTVPVAAPIATRAGAPLAGLEDAGVPRIGVLFPRLDGAEPDMSPGLVPVFRTLGDYAAQLHAHAAGFAHPPGFERPRLTGRTLLPADGLWGDWRANPDIDAPMRAVLESAAARLAETLDAYGDTADRFGLIHADMRLGNLLVAGERVALIDFDDCGFGFLLYDLAAALSFYEIDPLVPQLVEAWCAGYAARRALPPGTASILPAMILLRRFALTAWIGSHADTALARRHRPGYAAGTVLLAEKFLAA
jgi:Ser/Thr protein kinase RdoA (MazF antagonist)